MLWKWNTPMTYNCYSEEFKDNGEDVMVWTDAVTSYYFPPKIDENLTTEQRQELDALLNEFSEALDDVTGQTDITIHHIDTDNSPPILQSPYRIPHPYKETDKKELDLIFIYWNYRASKMRGHHPQS